MERKFNFDDFDKQTVRLKNKISKICAGNPAPYVITALAECLALNMTFCVIQNIGSVEFAKKLHENLDAVNNFIDQTLGD